MKHASSMVDTTICCPSKKLKEGSADTSLLVYKRKSMPGEQTISSCATSIQTKTKCLTEQAMQHKEVGTGSEKKRKRGRSPKTSIKCKERDGAACTIDGMAVKNRATSDVELLKITRESTGSGSVLAEAATELSDTGCSTSEVKMSMANLQSNVADVDKPISMWFDKCSLPTVIDSSFVNNCTVDQCHEANERLLEISTQHAIQESASNINSKEDSILSFVTHSSILKAIESTEIFQKRPQKPHFHRLDKSKEIYLEGLAIGYMVTFINVVEQTSKLQVSDSKSIFENIFKALLNLESYGFDVEIVRSRLSELQSIKERQQHLQEQLEEYESQIMKQTNEQLEVTVELDVVVKVIKVLEEKKAKLISVKEKNESEIAALKSKVNVVSEDIQNAELEFRSVAVAPW